MTHAARIVIRNPLSAPAWSTACWAGLAGGAAEIAWIMLFQHLSGVDAVVVARGITGTVFRQLEAASLAIPIGIAIHMGLAILLGVVMAILLRALSPRVKGTALEPVAVVAFLVVIWAVNFFIVLPAVNPTFVALIPYGASLMSKVVFGVAAALVFQLHGKSQLASERMHKETCHVQ